MALVSVFGEYPGECLGECLKFQNALSIGLSALLGEYGEGEMRNEKWGMKWKLHEFSEILHDFLKILHEFCTKLMEYFSNGSSIVLFRW